MSFDRPTSHLRPVVVLAIFMLALSLQTTVLSGISISGVKPDLVLVATLCIGLLTGPGTGAVLGAVAGMMEGYAQGMHLGTLGFSRSLASFLAGTVETHVQSDHVVVPTLTVMIGSLAAHAVYFVMAPEFPLMRPLRIALIETLLNMIFTPPLFMILARWGFSYRK